MTPPKQRLYTPGPTPVPDEVMEALGAPLIHHRSQEFAEVFQRVTRNLQYVFQTRHDVFTLTSSGTGAMEAAVCNILSSRERVLFVNAGKFGARWGEICRAYGVRAEELTVEWGRAAEAGLIGRRVREGGGSDPFKAVFLTQCETSTGVVHDVREIARTVRSFSEALIVVDGITSIGALELRMDEWGIDVALTASQKGLMVPPGLAFIALSDRAWRAVISSDLPRYYFDLRTAKEALAASATPWTPATSLIVGLDAALSMIRKEGMEEIWKRHRRLAAAMRAGCAAIGLRLFPSPPSDALTVVSPPPGVDLPRLIRTLREAEGIVVAGGQGSLKGKIMRIAHLGYFHDEDIMSFLSSLERCLETCGGRFESGSGINAALQVLRRS